MRDLGIKKVVIVGDFNTEFIVIPGFSLAGEAFHLANDSCQPRAIDKVFINESNLNVNKTEMAKFY